MLNVGSATGNTPAKLMVLDKNGINVEKIINLGQEIYDLDRTEDDKIALIGSFGVLILNDNFSVAWTDPTALSTSSKARVSIAETGEVAYIPFDSGKTGNINLYNSNGELMHVNDVYAGTLPIFM